MVSSGCSLHCCCTMELIILFENVAVLKFLGSMETFLNNDLDKCIFCVFK